MKEPMRRLMPFAAAVILAACVDSSGTAMPADAVQPEPTEQRVETTAAPQEEKPMSEYQNKVAEIKTGKGTIKIRFYPDAAPNHVRNFIDLASSGFYAGTRFHRVIPGFMIQGGDPNTKSNNYASWGMGGSDKNVKAEFNDISHKRGIVSAARSQDPNSASSQFFIVTSDSTFLDKQYTVFGEVIEGMDVADAIVNAPRGANDRPNDPIAIDSIEVRDAQPGEIPAAS